MASLRLASRYVPNLSLALLLAFSTILWVAGGASRADVWGQVVVRAGAWTCLGLLILFGSNRPFQRGRPVLLFLAAGAALALMQLVPLPPGLWSALPGRAIFGEVAAVAGEPAPWRPLAIVPSMALNALGSLIVPFVILCLATQGGAVRDGMLIRMLLVMVVAGMAVGLLQFASIPLKNPLINGGGEVSGTFANHNHFALMMACGLLLLPAWVFWGGRSPGWRGPLAIALILLLALAILASGSRAGMLVGIVALGCGLAMVRQPLQRMLGQYPRWVFPVLIAAIVLLLATLVALSVAADRAVSIDRALALDPGQDMRNRGLPTVLAMVREYLPAGAGLGGFDGVFRLHEPLDLLKPTYFNHAHNDFIEIVLDAGVLGLALVLAALGWWLWMSVRAWRAGSGSAFILPKLGSALLLVILLASIVDYPARTPTIMAIVVIAGIWLSEAGRPASALPKTAQHL